MKIIITHLAVEFDLDSYTGNSRERAVQALEKAKNALKDVGIKFRYCENFNWKVVKTNEIEVSKENS